MSGFYRTITISDALCGTANSSSFPVAFVGTYSWLATVANGGRVTSASGFDIVFCTNPASPITSALPFERVVWNATTGAVEFYVQVPTLSVSANTVIYVYYGDASITSDESNATGTWDSNFVGVWHLGNGTSLSLADSTSHGNTLTNVNGATAGASLLGSGGGGSASFTASSQQGLDGGNPGSLQITGAITLEAMCEYTGTLGTFAFVAGKTSMTDGYAEILSQSGGLISEALYFQVVKSSASPEAPTITSPIAINTPYGTAGVWDGSANISFFRDGVSSPLVSATTGLGNPTNTFQIGSGTTYGNYWWQGLIDEVRVSNVARSSSWLIATWNNQSSPSTFYALGTETAGGGGGGGLLINRGLTGNMQLLQGGCNG